MKAHFRKYIIFVVCFLICSCNSGGNIPIVSQNNVLNNKTHKQQIVIKLSQSYLNKAYGISTDGNGNLYVAMADQNLIEKFNVINNKVTIIAGNGNTGKPLSGQDASTQPLHLTSIIKPKSTTAKGNSYLKSFSSKSFYGSIAADSLGDVYIADSGNSQIEVVDHVTGIMSVIAGGGSGAPSSNPQIATNVELSSPTGVALDNNNNLYVADSGNFVVEKINLITGMLNVVAGGGNNNPTLTPQLANTVSIMPYGVATDKEGNVFITDQLNSFVEMINLASQQLSVIAGNGSSGLAIPGVATSSPLGSSIDELSVDVNNNIYVADASNNEIEKITNGQLSIIVGNGQNGYPYFANPTKSSLSKPHGVSVDQAGNIYIADTNNQIVEKYSQSSNEFYIDYGVGFIKLVGPFQCVNDPVSGNKCGCLYDPQGGNTWYSDISQSGLIQDWSAGGAALANFNLTRHCGLNNWHLPSAPNALYARYSPTFPGGEWSSLFNLALQDGYSSSNLFVIWMLLNGFTMLNTPADSGYITYMSSGTYSSQNPNAINGLGHVYLDLTLNAVIVSSLPINNQLNAVLVSN